MLKLRVDREHPVDGHDAHRDAVKHERYGRSEKAETAGRDQEADGGPDQDREKSANRERGNVEIEARDVLSRPGAAIRPGVDRVKAREQKREIDRQHRAQSTPTRKVGAAATAPPSTCRLVDQRKRNRPDRKRAPEHEADQPSPRRGFRRQERNDPHNRRRSHARKQKRVRSRRIERGRRIGARGFGRAHGACP